MTNFLPKILACVVLLFGKQLPVQAQFAAFQFGVNGLTCSQCSRSVEVQLKKLPFVDSVVLDLEHTIGRLVPIPGAQVQPEEIAKAIHNAGFSIRFLQAELLTKELTQKENQCFVFQHKAYYLQDGTLPLEANNWFITFTDPEFLPQKTWFWKTKKVKVAPRDAVCRSRKFYYIAMQSK